MNKIVRLLCLAAVPACCLLVWSDAAAVCSPAVRNLGHGDDSGFDSDPGCDPQIAPASSPCAGQDFLIDNQADWDSLWSRHISTIYCEPNTTCDCYEDENCPCCLPGDIRNHPAPAVNFATEVVLATFLGGRRTEAYNTSITCVQYTTTIGGYHPHADVTVLNREAGGTCNVGQTFTNWYHFVAAPRTTSLIQQQQNQSQSFTFQHQLQVISCTDTGPCQLCHPGQNPGEFGPPCCH